MANQRLSMRVPFRKRVKYGLSDPVSVGYTFNLSEGGIGIKADRVFHPKSRITVHIYTEDEIVKLEGVVIWVSPALPGILSTMGIKFSTRINDIKSIYQQRINQ
jgi:PilZ domain-containing protein